MRGGRAGGFGGGRGGRGGGRGGGGRGGGYGGQRSYASLGPPDSITEVGEVLHPCEEELVCRCTLKEQVPYFNGRIFLENKQEIGKIEEILGPINQIMFSMKLGDSIKGPSFPPNTKVYIDVRQTLPLSRFLPAPSSSVIVKKKKSKKGAPTGASTPSRGGFSRGGRGGSFSRGGGRGRGRGSRGR